MSEEWTVTELEFFNDWDAVVAFVKVSHAKAQGREEHFFVCFVV